MIIKNTVCCCKTLVHDRPDGFLAAVEIPRSENMIRLLRNIVVAVGGSKRSFTALKYALSLAKVRGAALQVLITEERRPSVEEILGDAESVRKMIEHDELLARALGDVTERRVREMAAERDVKITITRERGRVIETVMNATRGATLLILGKHGHRSQHGGLLGPNAETIIRRTHKSVLLTPDEYLRPTKVLIAYAAKVPVERILDAVAFAQIWKTPITVVTVTNLMNDITGLRAPVRQILQDHQIEASYVREIGDAAERIVAHSHPQTLLAMGAHSHSRVYRLAMGSVAEQVMRNARGPILIYGQQEPN